MIGTIPTNKKGEPLAEAVSDYQPSDDVKVLTAKIQTDYQLGYDNLHTPYRELQDRSVIADMRKGQKNFQAYVDPLFDDPDDDWRHEGVRPITRNQLISIAAHVTSTLLFPNVFAQNDMDEEDRASADLMRDLVKFNIRNSDYELKYLVGVLGALSNPCVFLHPQFVEEMQTIRELGENGELSTEEVVDETMSGFQMHVLPPDEILIANPYDDRSNQFQRFNFRQREIDFDEAKQLYEDHDNFKFVEPGVKHIFSSDDATFYREFDDQNPTVISEETYYNRREDTEIVFVNGVYMGNTNTEANPIQHRDNANRPKYSYVHLGYHTIPNFFYYKSAAAELENDQGLVDKMWRVMVDASTLDAISPVAISGDVTKMDASIIYPGRASAFKEGTKFEPITAGRNAQAASNLVEKVEQNMGETSAQDPSRRGIASQSVGTAFEQGILERNARIQLGLFGKSIANAITDVGGMLIDLILTHQTLGDIDEITAGNVRLNYRSFLIPDQDGDGKDVTKQVEFTDDLLGLELTDTDRLDRELELLDEAGGPDSGKIIIKANPELFRNLKFKVTIDADTMLPRNEAFEKAMNLEGYDRMITNPFVDQQKVTRDFLVKTFAKGETDEYMKQARDVGVDVPAVGGGGTNEGTSELVSQAAGTGSLRNLLAAA